MKDTLRRIGERLRDERGAGLIEYAMLVALIALVCFSALAYFGNGSSNSVEHSRDCIERANNGQDLTGC